MSATVTINRVRARRLRHLVILADDLAQAWWAGYAINAATWPSMADKCLRMHVGFRRRQQALETCLAKALRGQ